MSQHIKSNTDLSNNSNFDADAIGGLMTDLSHQESNATDRSSESASILQPNGMGITLMGLNHLQSSPLQTFVNPNINAPKLEIPPSLAQIPPDITPNGDDEKQNTDHRSNVIINSTSTKKRNSYRNKPPDVQLPNDDEKDIHDRQHPITPNTFNELSSPLYIQPTLTLSPIPPPSNDSPSLSQPHIKNILDFSPTDMAQLAAMSQFIPQFWDCLRDLTQNVNSIQQQFSKLNHSKALNHSAHSSTQTRYRAHSHSQSNSSINSLRTQTSIASNSTYNNTLNYSNHPGTNSESINMIPQTYSHRSLRNNSTFTANIPGSRTNYNDKSASSSRRNTRRSSTHRKKSTNLLGPQPQRQKSLVYNNYSQYPRRKSIGPGAVGSKSPHSISPKAFAYSPKGNKQYQLTADSLELLHISQRQKKMQMEEHKNESPHDHGGKKPANRRLRNRSQTLFMSSKEKRHQQYRQKRRTISEVNNNNKIEDTEGGFTDEEEDFLAMDDEVSLYSSAALDTMTSISNLESSVPQQPTTPSHALSIIHSASEHSQFGALSPNKINTSVDEILFEEEVEGDGKEKLSNKFHRKKKPPHYIKDRKPSTSSAATSSITHRSNSELSISSMANTAETYNSRSVPHSPAPEDTETTTKHPQITAISAYTGGDRTRRKSAGPSSHHLYPTPKATNSKRAPTLMQSHSAHNIYAIKATATNTTFTTTTTTTTTRTASTPQRPNTPTKGDATTPRNTPNKTAVDAATISNSIAPMNAYDINARSVYSITENGPSAHAMNKRRNSLTPPQEDKEQDEISDSRYGLSIGPFDEESAGGDVVIVDDEEMIINGENVAEVQVYNGYHTELMQQQQVASNVVEEAAHVLFTEQEHQNGEDSVSISMTSSRPPSTKLNKNVHFDMHSIKNEYSIHDIEEHKVATDDAISTTPEIVSQNNLLPSQVKYARNSTTKRGKNRSNKRGHDKILKLKNHIAYHHNNDKNRRGNLRKLKLSQQNLKAHNLKLSRLNQLKNRLLDAKLEKQHVAKMTSEQLQEMLIYINRIQWLILDEKQKRECCKICAIATTSFALLLPCNHQSVCYQCASNLKDCPICNRSVTQIVLPIKR